MITTDYTYDVNKNTLCGAPLTRYRFAHWLCDIVKNFMSSPENMRDERLRGLLWPQDGVEPDECRAAFRVGLPLGSDSRKASVTPAILVSAGQQGYPMSFVNNGVTSDVYAAGGNAMYRNTAVRQVTGKIAVVTESLDGTLLLCDTLEDYLVTNTHQFVREGMVGSFHLDGSSEPAMLRVGEAANAKELYQSVITVTVSGGLTWETDTQGPVFRGMTIRTATI